MKQYSLAPQARADIDGIWDYLGIEKMSPAAARGQIEMLYEKFSLLASHPLVGEIRPDLGAGLRSFVAKKYVVVYRVSGGRIEIARVVHSARDIRKLFGS